MFPSDRQKKWWLHLKTLPSARYFSNVVTVTISDRHFSYKLAERLWKILIEIEHLRKTLYMSLRDFKFGALTASLWLLVWMSLENKMNWGDNQKGKGRASKQDRSFLLRFVEFCKILCESETSHNPVVPSKLRSRPLAFFLFLKICLCLL